MSRSETIAEQRSRMVDDQLRRRGIRDVRVLSAMHQVPREAFVPAVRRSEAYDDRALPLEFGQTISQPYTVAFMCEAARIAPHEHVLEIGTGSGYGAAVLAALAADVVSVERIPKLADAARRRLHDLGIANVHVLAATESLDVGEFAPFDVIVVTACAPELPESLVRQLAPGGRIIIPIGRHGEGQTMFRFAECRGRLEREDLGEFSFVPLLGVQPMPAAGGDV